MTPLGSQRIEPLLPSGTQVVGGWGVGDMRSARGPVQRCVGRNPRGADAPLDVIRYVDADADWLQQFIDDVETWGDAAGPSLLRVMAAGRGPRADVAVRVLEAPRGVPMEGMALPLPTWRAIRVADDVAKALSAAHARGLVHGELSPQCIYVDGSSASIEPGGLREALRAARATQVPPNNGPEVAPEARQGTAARSSDIYALGAVMCRLTTGLPPVDGAGGHAAPASEVPLDPELRHLMVACLQGDPMRRPPAAEVVAQLHDLASRFPTVDGSEQSTPATVGRTVEPRMGLVDVVVPPAAPPAGDMRSVTPLDERHQTPPKLDTVETKVPYSAMVVVGLVLLVTIGAAIYVLTA